MMRNNLNPSLQDNILGKIIQDKIQEVAERKSFMPLSSLEQRDTFDRDCISLKQSLLNSSSGIIAEFKRKSPSKGWIHENADVTNVTTGYCQNGASGISILTDYPYFGGKPADLINVREKITCPILRKDFMIDEYQLFEAKSFGADVVLLIAAALTTDVCLSLARRAKELGMETLLEIHNADELKYINNYIDIVGVNNRDLKTFKVSTDVSLSLAELIPDECVKISESGISDVETVRNLKKAGFKGFLMGENFMKEENPAQALKNFIEAI